MATTRDYYEVLGVAETATDAELKAAYRKQALQWHPDRNKTKDAEVKFKEVNEAYEVLSDPQKRQTYDQFGHAAFQQGGVGQSPFSGGSPFGRAGSQGPFTWSYTTTGDMGDFGFSDPFEIFEQFFGGGSPFGARQRAARKPIYSLQIDFMEAVNGVSKEVEVAGKRKTIKIPAGVDEGTRIRFDEFDVVISVRPHKNFRRDNYDIYTEISLSVAEATLGTIYEVPTIDGTVKLNIKAGVQPGTLMRLREKGVPHVRGGGRGDQYVKIMVAIPTHLNRRQKELFEELRHS